MASTRSTVRCGGGQHGGERWHLPRGRWRQLPTCPMISDRWARKEETATDRWARLYFVISKLF
jgi:hypothetical protein